MEIVQFYAKKGVKKAIVDMAKDREIAVQYNASFGKRPDVLVYDSDVFECAKQGATSFHLSEERWLDPLQIVTGMHRKKLDELRKGWDLLLDIDSPFLEFSRQTAILLLEAMKFHSITNVGIKYSGNKGFHLIIPFEAFPSTVGGVDSKLLFPEGPRMVADYLSHLIKDPLREEVLSISSIKEILEATKKKKEELSDKDGIFNPLKVVEIDTVLISSRHLFRSPYSMNEKTKLISTPIKASTTKTFSPKQAKMENIEDFLPFMPKAEEGEASQLFIQASDYMRKKQTIVPTTALETAQTPIRRHQQITEKVPEELFPPCVQHILSGLDKDGRKRALFILINFLQNMNYSFEEMEKTILEWNEKNYEPLREGYVRSQLSWHKRQAESKLPPNCENRDYYASIGVCNPDNFCGRIKNPTNYSLFKMKTQQELRAKKKRTKKKSS